ncbi:hypothetical protein Tco_0233817 [Tanacetum coccineum]
MSCNNRGEEIRTSSNTRNHATVQDGRVVVQNVQGQHNRGQGNNARGGGAAGHIARNCTQPKRLQNSEYFKDKMLLMQAQENRVALDEEQLFFITGGQDNAIDKDVDEQLVHDLALNVDNVFQADDCDAFDSDVDEAPMAQTMFMANLLSADPVYDEVGLSYDSDILSEVLDHDHYQDVVCEHHEEHGMHDDVQPNYVVDSHADYTSDSNMIPYDQYVKYNAVPVIQSNVSSVPNDVYMMIYNDMYEPHAQSVSKTTWNTIVDNSLTTELATYNKQVKLYERRVRKKMNDKMKDPECVTHKVKIAPPDYSKENYLATFTPQKQLTPEQICWSQDLIKMKAEALKEQTTTSRPIKALTVYPPNTPTTLVPRVLPTKSQVKINIFSLIQFFSEFDKTCKKKITPTELTEGERGFEQTKECYLTEVIPFFKTLKEHFEGIQKALTKEVKEMKDIFEELEAEIDQNVVDRKHDEIEQKNLLIANDNLLFTKMHDAHTIVKARCLELKVELSILRDKIQKDNHNELVKRFSNLEVNHLNLQLKYQNLKESFGNNPPSPARDTPNFDSVFVIEKMKASLQGKDNVIKKLKTQISHLQETHSEADRTLDFRALDFQITQLTKKVTVLQEQNELFKGRKWKNQAALQRINKVKSVTKDHVKPTVLAQGKYAIDVEPIPPRNRNNRAVHLDYLKHLKESVETLRKIVKEAKVERPLDRSIVSSCRYTKHSQELLKYAIATCSKDYNQRDKKKKQVTFEEQCDTSNSNTHKHVEQLNTQKSNALCLLQQE